MSSVQVVWLLNSQVHLTPGLYGSRNGTQHRHKILLCSRQFHTTIEDRGMTGKKTLIVPPPPNTNIFPQFSVLVPLCLLCVCVCVCGEREEKKTFWCPLFSLPLPFLQPPTSNNNKN